MTNSASSSICSSSKQSGSYLKLLPSLMTAKALILTSQFVQKTTESSTGICWQAQNMTEFRTNDLSTGIPPFLANSSFLPYYDACVWYQEHSLSSELVAV
jgi:hypothetical protein